MELKRWSVPGTQHDVKVRRVSVCIYTHLISHLSVCPPVCLSVCLPAFLSVCLLRCTVCWRSGLWWSLSQLWSCWTVTFLIRWSESSLCAAWFKDWRTTSCHSTCCSSYRWVYTLSLRWGTWSRYISTTGSQSILNIYSRILEVAVAQWVELSTSDWKVTGSNPGTRTVAELSYMSKWEQVTELLMLSTLYGLCYQ